MTTEFGRLASIACFEKTQENLDRRVFSIIDDMLKPIPITRDILKNIAKDCLCAERKCEGNHQCKECEIKSDKHDDKCRRFMKPRCELCFTLKDTRCGNTYLDECSTCHSIAYFMRTPVYTSSLDDNRKKRYDMRPQESDSESEDDCESDNE